MGAGKSQLGPVVRSGGGGRLGWPGTSQPSSGRTLLITSAGILLYRRSGAGLDVWIGHMGGPFWARKDTHAWSIPKGEYLEGEEPLAAALREFGEEMGSPAPDAEYSLLGTFRQSSKKSITVLPLRPGSRRTGSTATPLHWSGRRARAKCGSTRRLTTPGGSPSPWPAPSWSRDRCRSWMR